MPGPDRHLGPKHRLPEFAEELLAAHDIEVADAQLPWQHRAGTIEMAQREQSTALAEGRLMPKNLYDVLFSNGLLDTGEADGK